MIEYARAWPLMRDATWLESGARYRRVPDGIALADPQLPRPEAFCNPRIQRAVVTARLSFLDAVAESGDFSSFDRAAESSQQALVDLLRCSPLDGNAWLRRAMLGVQQSGPTPDVIAALKASYLTAPADLWIMRARIPFSLLLISSGVEGVEPYLRAELDLFLPNAFARDIATVYASTPTLGRAMLDERLRQFDANRYVFAYRALVAAGVTPDPQNLPPPPPPPPRYPRP